MSESDDVRKFGMYLYILLGAFSVTHAQYIEVRPSTLMRLLVIGIHRMKMGNNRSLILFTILREL